MTTKADFTEEEWAELRRAPLLAGMAITLADPGGPVEVFKETAAVLKDVLAAADGRSDLVGEVARELREAVQHRQRPLGEFKPRGADAGAQVLEELARVRTVVDAKATAEESEAFRAWLVECAQRAAEAAKEGGFLGFHAVRVSEGEERMLDQLRSTLGVAPAG